MAAWCCRGNVLSAEALFEQYTTKQREHQCEDRDAQLEEAETSFIKQQAKMMDDKTGLADQMNSLNHIHDSKRTRDRERKGSKANQVRRNKSIFIAG